METSDFDELLLSVHDVPFLGLAVAIHDVAGLEETVGVEGLGVGFGVLEIARHDGWASDAEFASGVVGCDVFAVVVDNSDVLLAGETGCLTRTWKANSTWRQHWGASFRHFQSSRPPGSGTWKQCKMFQSFPTPD